MRLKKKLYKYLLLGGIILSLGGSGLPSIVNAEESSSSKAVITYQSDNQDVKSSAYLDDESAMSLFIQVAKQSNELVGRDVLSYNGVKKVIYFDNAVYQDMYLDQREEFMKHALSIVKNSKLNPKGKNKVYNFLTSQDSGSSKILRNLKEDVSADIAGGKEWYEPFNGPITTILGIVALSVFILTGISFVLDISYLVVPPIRRFIDDREGGTLPKLISSQAYFVVRDRDLMSTGGYMASYFKRRVWVVFLLFIALGYLNSGFIFEVIGNFMQVFSDAFME